MRSARITAVAAWVLALWTGPTVAAAPVPRAPADTVYRHGFIYTMNDRRPHEQALAVRAGRIVYVGRNAGAQSYIGTHTVVHELHGRMLMPGLIDGHMHPLAGGRSLVKCNLNYERLDVSGLQARVRACLAATRDREPDGWLEVANWFQEAMVGGTSTSKAVLDSLDTQRPILVFSSFGHTALVNSRALALAGITAETPDPVGGVIEHDSAGAPTGILQDAAFERVFDVVPKPTPEQDIAAAEAALDALRRQGVTTALDAAADEQTITAFAGAKRAGKLTARLHFAVHILPGAADSPETAIARARALANRFDAGALSPEPGLTVRNIKLFLDGVISAPALTGSMIEPYFENHGLPGHPHWVPGANRGPAVYFNPQQLAALLRVAAAADLEPHLHADGDRAVRAALDAIESLREQYPENKIRAAIAHDEIVDPADYARYRRVGAIPVLSFQWEKAAPDTVEGERDQMGPMRYRIVEPAGLLARAGAHIAFGSDWPVDPLDEWLALQIGVTRTNVPEAGEKYRWRLGEDPGLTRDQVLRAATLGAARELHQERETGSLVPGKLADFIIIDRNVLKVPAEQIAGTRVLETVVGGRTVYEAPQP